MEIDDNITKKQNDVSRLRKEHIIIDQTLVLIDVNVKTLETLQEALKTQPDELCMLGVDVIIVLFYLVLALILFFHSIF